jgi:hypothetical protein
MVVDLGHHENFIFQMADTFLSVCRNLRLRKLGDSGQLARRLQEERRLKRLAQNHRVAS